jgi:Fe-Mn family superoxide dismutase
MITLPELPFSKDALEPHISAKTLEFHYGKHHQGYVNNTNNLIKGTKLENESLETIIQESFKDPNLKGLFNNSAQVFNHTFYWNCLTPNGGDPTGDILDLIQKDFGDVDALKEEMKKAAATLFGSGWAWLVLENDSLKIQQFSNADTPMVHGLKPLFTIDVWEHAYYLDYQNRRPDYITSVLDHLVNWEFVNQQLKK